LNDQFHVFEVIPHHLEIGYSAIPLRDIDPIISQEVLDGDHLCLCIEKLSGHGVAQVMAGDLESCEPKAMELLKRYGWPGNVRELENVMERAVALVSGPVIRVKDLTEHLRGLSVETHRQYPSDIPTLEAREKRYIEWVLKKTGANKTKADKIMAIDPVSLWRKMKWYGIEIR
jgi:DNA-binding NtrC family response regulator